MNQTEKEDYIRRWLSVLPEQDVKRLASVAEPRSRAFLLMRLGAKYTDPKIGEWADQELAKRRGVQ